MPRSYRFHCLLSSRPLAVAPAPTMPTRPPLAEKWLTAPSRATGSGDFDDASVGSTRRFAPRRTTTTCGSSRARVALARLDFARRSSSPTA